MTTLELHPKEQVFAVVRKSILREISRMVLGMIFLLVPFFFFFPLLSLGPLGFVVFISLLGFGLLYASRVWIMWFYSVLIVTQERVIDADQQGLFQREICEVPLEEISEVSVEPAHGVARLARLKTVYIRTKKDYSFDVKIPDVTQAIALQDLLGELMHVEKKKPSSSFHA